MGLKPFFCYYGGKWRAAPHYPAPTHDLIVEPFAGAAGYSTRHYDRNVLLIEKDPKTASLWRYLVGVSGAEIAALPLVFDHVDSLSVCVEAKYLIGFWLNKGAAQPCKIPSQWMRSRIRPASYWGEEIRARIASQVEKIRHWKIQEGDYFEAPDVHATWFVDPPYQRQGRFYKHGSTAIDYSHLALFCEVIQGQVIVCENEGADWLPFRPFRDIKANPTTKVSREVIWP